MNGRRSLESWHKSDFISLIHRYPSAIMVADINGNVIYLNPTFTKIFGYSLEDINTWEKWLKRAYPDPQYREYILSLWRSDIARAKKGEVSPRYLKVQAKKGNILEIKFRLLFLKGEHIILTAEDITEKKRLERETLQSETKYRHLFMTTPFAIILLDSSLHIVDCNPAAENLLGTKKEDLIGPYDRFWNFIPAEYHSVATKRAETLKNGKTVSPIDIQLYRRDRTKIWANATSSLLKLDDKSYFQLIIHEITHRKEMEQKLRTSEKKYRFSYNHTRFLKDLFSHDITNILQSILSTVDLYKIYKNKSLLGKDEGPKKVDELFEMIHEQVRRGEDLVSNVNILSRLLESEISPQKMKIYEVLKSVRSSILQRFSDMERAIEIIIKCENRDLFVPRHSFLIDALKNLILNAIKQNLRSKTNLLIVISQICRDDKSFVRLAFEDENRDISEKQKAEMFKGGFDVNKEYKRTELGLVLVKQIIERLGGRIWVEDRIENDPSQGSTFVILLPQIRN